MKFPKISIVTCTYNGERVMDEYLKNIFLQDYPKNKIELILADGGSSDKTVEIIRKYKKKYPKIIRFMHNPKKVSIGKGMGMDNATRKARGEIIVQLDQDNILVQKDWLKNMISILMKDEEVVAVQSRMAIPKNATLTDKYLNAIGIEDPFAVDYSLNAQIVFNPRKFQYKRGYYIYEINRRNFLYAGDNGFAIRRREFLETGGYTQDIDNFYRMALSKKKYKIAVPKNIKLYHKTSTEFAHFLKKRGFYVRFYLLENYEERDHYWISRKNNFRENFKYIKTVLFNLAFVPGLIHGIKMALREKKSFWLIHPIMLFSITCIYISSFFYAKIFKKQKAENI